MERSKAGTKKRNPDDLSLPNQNIIIINIILLLLPSTHRSNINTN